MSAVQANIDVSAIYRRFSAMVRGRAARVLGNTAAAEDVTQEVFIDFLRRRDRGQTERDSAAMLYRMATNAAINRLRDSRRRHHLHEQRPDVEEDLSHTPPDWLALRRVLSVSDPEEAQIAAYYYFDGLEHEEIAQLLSMQRRTVGRRLERFLEHARELVGEDPKEGRDAS